MTVVTFIPICCYLSSNFSSIFPTWATIMFGFIIIVSSPSILVYFEKTLLRTFSNFSMWIKFICILSTIHIQLSWRCPSNCIIALVLIFTLWPIKLAFHLILKRRLVNVIFQFSEIYKCTKMSVIQITISKIWSFLSNCKLNTPSSWGTNSITFFYCILFISKTWNSISINLVTKSILLKKDYINIIICALFSCCYGVTFNSYIIVFIKQVSMSTLADGLIRISVSCSSVHLPVW